jgi:hypothetical protein
MLKVKAEGRKNEDDRGQLGIEDGSLEATRLGCFRSGIGCITKLITI